MADKGIPFDVPTRANLLQGQRLIDEQLREKAARDAKLSPLDKAYAALEAARTFGSGILATVGSLPTRAIKGEDAAQEYINQRMYIPTTEKGMDYVGNVGDFLEQLETKYKLPPVLPEAVALQNVMGPAAKQATKQAAKVAKPVVGKALEEYMFKQGLAMPVVKPKGGNWLGGNMPSGSVGNVDKMLDRYKTTTVAGQTPAERIPLHERALLDLDLNDEGRATIQRHLNTTKGEAAVDKWIENNIGNYIKKDMATPNDPVRLMFERRAQEIEAQFQLDMNRAERTRARAEAETDPRRQANLMRQAAQQEEQAKFDRDFANENATHLPREEDRNLRLNSDREILDNLKNKRQQAGFSPEGMAVSDFAKRWENLTDEAIGINRAGDIQAQKEAMSKAQDAERAFLNKDDEINETFRPRLIEKLAKSGNPISDKDLDTLVQNLPTSQKAEVIGEAEEWNTLRNNFQSERAKVNDNLVSAYNNNQWINKLDPETNVYSAYIGDLGIDHVVDVIRQDVAAGRIRPEQLNKLSMDQAIQRTAEFNMEQAKKMAEAQIKATEGMPVYKDYPEGYKWIELTTPKPSDVLPEGWTMLEPKNGYMRASSPDGAKVIGEDMPNLIKNLYQRHPDAPGNPRQVLEDALKYEGDTMGHCVGGYCPDVMEGRSRIFSLRDAKGEPHVTVETQPKGAVFSDVAKHIGKEEAERLLDQGVTLTEMIKNIPDFQYPQRIKQIKGKQNAAPKEEYLPFVQDFVRSGQWSDVGDLRNTGLIKNDGKYMTQSEYDDYLLNQLQPPPVEGMKRGGSVHIADNPDTMMMEVEDQKFVGGGIAKAAKTAAKSAVATRELEKQAVLRAEAAAKSAAKQALMPQYNEAVKGQTQKQKPLSFEQWKAINYPEGTQGLQNAHQKQTFKYPQEEAMRLAQQRAALPIEQGGLGLPANNTPEMRAEAMGAVDWLHGTERLDRLLEKKNLDPRKSTSGPMPYGTNAGELASNYAMNKADTSLSATDTGEMPNYFQVFPKSMGQRGSSPRSVESVWYSLPQEKKAEILEKAKRVGYENFDEATGPLTLHPEGVNAMNVAEDTWNYYLNRESKGNPLAALRAIWGESGTLFGQEEKLADIYKLAGFPYEISQTNAPWTTAKGVMTGKAMISNPLNTSNAVEIQEKVIPFLKEQFKNDRTRKKDFGADQWDKNFRYTPKEWISKLEDDIAAGNNSYVWTSIPDKVTQSLKKAGYNGIIDKSGKGGGVQEDVIIPFEPEQLRSRFAAFDPFRKTAATAAAMGVAAPDLLAEENKANGGSVNLDAMYMAVNDAKFRRK
jgi:hypothetical protein